MYRHGRAVPENNVEAVAWFRKAAEQGHAASQSNLGAMYQNGEGVPENDVEAIKWFRKAAEQGYAEAQYKLGLMYSKGEGVTQDLVSGFAWVHLANEQFHRIAWEDEHRMRRRITPQQLTDALKLSRELAKNIPVKHRHDHTQP